MTKDTRPDLSNRTIISLLLISFIVVGIILIIPKPTEPGSKPGQLAASMGSLLLLAPAVFLIMKRSGLSASPPVWFVLHVVSAFAGSCLIFVHVRSADWLTPPGVVLFLLVFLIIQGSYLRVVISRSLSLLFARNSTQQGFGTPNSKKLGDRKMAIQTIIDRKTELLKSIDLYAQEALYSPTLKDWLRHPVACLRYQRLAAKEAKIVGARNAAGKTLAWSRRIHMAVATLFYLGLLTHVIVVLFFAGYASGGGPVNWWHITDWGRPQ